MRRRASLDRQGQLPVPTGQFYEPKLLHVQRSAEFHAVNVTKVSRVVVSSRNNRETT